ncbi:FtsK/SpoIIIE domain-containing protein [bacterium]|nr:FtsK/SpoIIIE domain-containing protein [bacterium]
MIDIFASREFLVTVASGAVTSTVVYTLTDFLYEDSITSASSVFFAIVATMIPNWIIGQREDNGYWLKKPKAIEKVKVDEKVEVVVKPKPTIAKPVVESFNQAAPWQVKAKEIQDALYSYQYSANQKICVQVKSYSKNAPMVEIYNIVPIEENAWLKLFKDKDVEFAKLITSNIKESDKIIKKGADINALSKLGDNLSRDLKLPKGVKISVDVNVGGGMAAIYLPKENRDWVITEDYLDEVEESKQILPMFFGKGLDQQSVTEDLVDGPHGIIIGETKSGKTVSIQSKLLLLANARSPKFVEFVLIDPKLVGLRLLNGLPHVRDETIVDMNEAATYLTGLVDDMNDRNRQLVEMDVQNIEEYNAIVSEENKMRYKVIVIDEFLDLLEDDGCTYDEEGNEDHKNTIGKVSTKQLKYIFRKGRSIGFHVVLLAQRFAAEDVPGSIRNNVGMNLCMSVSDAHASKMVIGEHGGENLLKYGDSLLKMNGWNAPVRIQGGGFKNDSKDIRALVTKIGEKWQDELQSNSNSEVDENVIVFGGRS